jgi:flagellar basal-body rod modification protein FlgD
VQISSTPPAPRAAGATGTGAPTQATATPPSQQVDYMKLIVAQMQNLNPMDPSSGGDGLGTMMQAESLNQLSTLNTALKTLQTLTQTGYAASLMGKTVTGVDATNSAITGTVVGVHMDASGPLLDLSGGKQMRLLDVTQVAGATGTATA